MKFDLKTASPWHEFSAMLLNASSMSIDGYEGESRLKMLTGICPSRLPPSLPRNLS